MMTAAPQIVTLGAHVLDTIVQPVDEIPEADALVLFKDHKYKCEIIEGAGYPYYAAISLDDLGLTPQ